MHAFTDDDWVVKGELREDACSILMGIFYAARMARWELLFPTSILTRFLTKWTAAHDKMLNRLVAYIYFHLNDCMTGYIGDNTKDLFLGVHVDADHGGDVSDVRATTGALVVLQGPNTWFPLSVICKKQTSNSNGSTESETVALSHILRQEAIPTLQLWETLLGRKVHVEIYEDNQGTIDVIRNGYSPALRHLLKTQKCSIDLIHHIVHEKNLADIVKVGTDKQVADIFTKSLNGPAWNKALEMLHVERGVNLRDAVRAT